MSIIVITSPTDIEDEINIIHQLFDSGLHTLHLRKPSYTLQQTSQFLEKIDDRYHHKIVLHDYFSLIEQFHVKGVHLNQRNPDVPPLYSGSVSCSCHSLQEIKKYKLSCNYLFLSPIFDSISKEGYLHQFNDATLKQAASEGVIDTQVYALGGVTEKHFPYLQQIGFGGAVLMGAIWKKSPTEITPYFQSIQSLWK